MQIIYIDYQIFTKSLVKHAQDLSKQYSNKKKPAIENQIFNWDKRK